MLKNEKKNSRNKKTKIWSRFLLICFVLFILYSFLKWPFYDWLLQEYGKTTIGKITNEKGYNGKGGHMLKEEDGDKIIYEYEFQIKGEKYYGDSQNSDYKTNDTINVVYLEKLPGINRPKYYLWK